MTATTSDQGGSVPVRTVQPWIVNWRQDLLWFVGPPLFLVPTFAMLLKTMSLERLSILVVSFGAVGHHLPGMLRAYGDTELFARYRLRFILAPIFLISISIAFSYYRPDALSLLVLIWGLWHSQAQIYGFLRIYDAKAGLTDRRTALIDRFVCISWFSGGVLMSEGRVADFLTTYYRNGGTSLAPESIEFIQTAVAALMGCAAVFYLVNTIVNGYQGRSPNPVKLLTLVLSIGFWWYCMVGIRNVVLGIALYEVFHDMQYLAIVWFFNLRRASVGPGAGWLTRFLFRPRAKLVFVYVGLVLIYGAGSLLTRSMTRSHLQTILTGLFVASGLLHFYYDGFIWRIRNRETGQSLGVRNDSPVVSAEKVWFPGWAVHLAMWGIFVTPLVIFAFTPQSAEAYRKVVTSMPHSAIANFVTLQPSEVDLGGNGD